MRWRLAAASGAAAVLLLVVLGNDRVSHWTIDPSTRLEMRLRTEVRSPLLQTIHGTLTLNEDDPDSSSAEATVTPANWTGSGAPIAFESTSVHGISPSSLTMEGTLRMQDREAPITVQVDLSEPPILNPQKQRVRRGTAELELEPTRFGLPSLGAPARITVHLVLVEH